MDIWLQNLPVIGNFFEHTYEFWRANIAVANTTHIMLGFGLALVLVSKYKKIGVVLLAIALSMHVVAYLK